MITLKKIENGIAIFEFPDGISFVVDEEDAERVAAHKWALDKTPHGKPYIRCREKGFAAILPRFLLEVPSTVLVRHVDGNTFNNRKDNLHAITPFEAAQLRDNSNRTSASGMQNVAIQHNTRDGTTYYFAAITRNGIRKQQSFPYTAEGLADAAAIIQKWKEDITYEPPRSYQSRMQHDPDYQRQQPVVERKVTHISPYNMPVGTWRVDGESAYLIIHKSGIETAVSLQDMPRVARHPWHRMPNSQGGYYAASKINRKTVYLHRFLLDAPYHLYVDHINHDTLDNRRENLRLTTKAQNDANRAGAYVTSKTGIRGVSIHTYKNGQHAYVFRCHIKTCPVAKYFEYSERGLDDAAKYSATHYEAMAARMYSGDF